MSDEIDDPAAHFWAGLEADEFRVPRCQNCGYTFFPPGPLCPDCGSRDIGWMISNEGILYSFTRQHRTAPGFDSPLVMGLVDLEAGPRVLTPIDSEYERLQIGQRVRLVSTEYSSEYDRGPRADRPFFAAIPYDGHTE